MFFGLIPENQEHLFFEKFERLASKMVRGIELLWQLVEDLGTRKYENRGAIAEIESAMDEIARETYELIDRSFVTPFEREDIFALTKALDDVMDEVDDLASRLFVYKINKIRPDFRSHILNLVEISKETKNAVYGLRELHKGKNLDEIKKSLLIINKLEAIGDSNYLQSLEDLFSNETDPVEIIKWKEIYDMVEDSTDSCENVANLIYGMIIKNG